MNWKEYIINFLKNPSETIEFVNEKYSMKKMFILILLGGLLLLPNFIIFQFRGEYWIYIAFLLGLIGLLAAVYVNYQVIFYVLSKIMYRNSDYPFDKIRKINIWYVATAFLLCMLLILPLQLIFLYIKEYGVGLFFYWLVVLIWHIWAMALEYQTIQFYVKDRDLKNMYFTIITQICGFGIYQILIYIGFLSMY
ncbi:MAG: hypothetical protein HWN67_02545 [Candidatus Helarchaeota archaeon]|nr:hypothetical protein [Candidatus Helarchaeota archaeon]